MMTRFIETDRMRLRWGLLVSFVLYMIVAAGCGVEKAPLAAGDESAEMAVAPQGQSFIVFNPLVAERAAKKIKNEGKKIKGKFNHKGGELVIEEEGEWGDRDRNSRNDRGNSGEAKKKIAFQITRNAVPKGDEVEIEMEIWGDYASELVVGFTPSGYEFQEDCVLEIEIKGDWVDLGEDQIQALHISASGGVEAAQVMKIKVKDGELNIKIRIPGFSRYSMGGGA